MKTKQKYIWGILGGVGLACFYLIVVLSFWLFSKDRVYPGVSVAGTSLSLKTKEEAKKILEEKTNTYGQTKLSFEGKELTPSDLGVKYEVEKTVEEAVLVGGKNPFFLGWQKDLSFQGTFDQEKVYKKITEFEKEKNKPVTNSEVKKTEEGIKVVDGAAGQRINYAETANNFATAFKKLDQNVKLVTFSVEPTFKGKDFVSKETLVREKITGTVTFTAEGKKFEVPAEKIYTWVQVPSDNRTLAFRFGKENIFSQIFAYSNTSLFSEAKIKEYLSGISKDINQAPVNAELSLSNGRATVFVPSQEGKTLELDKSSIEVSRALESGEKEIALSVNISKPEITEESINNMGILELIGTGFSNYAGSPTNRKHNIKTGASKFNGVLIKPDETFSFVKTLGPVDASTGYLPELVIKENKTIPEYGGGMCQVSSTAFRAALNSGLPILERSAHSYPVQYYKPYGVDATVYIPKPDLVFKNDTGKYILIQTKIEGTKLTFDFYGTKPKKTVKFSGFSDGREAVFPVEKVNPNIYDQGIRGNNSFTAEFYRFIYDESGKLTETKKFISKYDSPDKYPH